MQRSRVDLPEPDAPMTHTTSCSASDEVDPAQDLELAERLVQPFDPQRAGRERSSAEAQEPAAPCRRRARR